MSAEIAARIAVMARLCRQAGLARERDRAVAVDGWEPVASKIDATPLPRLMVWRRESSWALVAGESPAYWSDPRPDDGPVEMSDVFQMITAGTSSSARLHADALLDGTADRIPTPGRWVPVYARRALAALGPILQYVHTADPGRLWLAGYGLGGAHATTLAAGLHAIGIGDRINRLALFGALPAGSSTAMRWLEERCRVMSIVDGRDARCWQSSLVLPSATRYLVGGHLRRRRPAGGSTKPVSIDRYCEVADQLLLSLIDDPQANDLTTRAREDPRRWSLVPGLCQGEAIALGRPAEPWESHQEPASAPGNARAGFRGGGGEPRPPLLEHPDTTSGPRLREPVGTG